MAFTLNNNEFLANLTNLCLQVAVFNSFTFNQRFSAFARQYTKWGDKIACVNAWVGDGENYDLSNSDFTNPYKATIPAVAEHTITTALKKRYSFRVAEDVLRGAFEDENSLGDFVTMLVAQLHSMSEYDIYEKVVSDLGLDYNGQAVSTTDIANKKYIKQYSGGTDEETAKNLYTHIITTAQEMCLPNTVYGVGYTTFPTATRKACARSGQDLVLYVTPEMYSKLMTYVNASLFNSSEIAFNKWIGKVEVVDLDGFEAMLCTNDFYRYSPRIKEMRTKYNEATLEINYFWHVWTNMGKTNAGQRAYFIEA